MRVFEFRACFDKINVLEGIVKGYELGNPSTGNVEVLKLKGWE